MRMNSEPSELFRQFRHVNPLAGCAGAFELIDGQACGGCRCACRGEHLIKAAQGPIKIDVTSVVHTKGTNATHTMAYKLLDLIGGKHFGLGMETILEFTVIDTRVTCEKDQSHSVPYVERKRLGDVRGLAPNGRGSELDRCARLPELHDAVFQTQCRKVLACSFD